VATFAPYICLCVCQCMYTLRLGGVFSWETDQQFLLLRFLLKSSAGKKAEVSVTLVDEKRS
jgi:hypothetical protein